MAFLRSAWEFSEKLENFLELVQARLTKYGIETHSIDVARGEDDELLLCVCLSDKNDVLWDPHVRSPSDPGKYDREDAKIVAGHIRDYMVKLDPEGQPPEPLPRESKRGKS